MTGENSRIFELLSFALNGSNVLPGETFAGKLVQDCLELYMRDYICTVIDNAKGNLCSTYPVKLIVPLKQKSLGLKKSLSGYELEKMSELIHRGKFARTRGRFPAPVLLIGDKFVCRSSTLARSPEIYGRTGYHYFLSGDKLAADNDQQCEVTENGKVCNGNGVHSDVDTSVAVQFKSNVNGQAKFPDATVVVNGNTPKKKFPRNSSPINGANGKSTQWLIDKMRNNDIDLLSFLKTNVICDFMVEKKKVKFGMNVTSSEKVDRQQRYSKFDLISIPYPGCEFFADYTNNNYTGVGLKFDWTQQFVDAQLQVPDNMNSSSGVDWEDYVHWDLVKLTQNYLKLLINCVCKSDCHGILLHCISGWDRTPLFVSLLRLSLWADGLIHQSLNPEEIVYLTLAYDWLLFSHQLSDRIDKSEEIMRFCFDFLEHIVSEEYSLLSGGRHVDVLFPLEEKENEEMFYLESSEVETNGFTYESNGPSETASETNYRHCANSFQGDSTFNLEDVRQCIESIVAKVVNQAPNGHLEESDVKKRYPNGLFEANSTPAIIQLSDTNLATKELANGNCQNPIAPLTNKTFPTNVLSSSFETAKLNIALQSKLDDNIKTLSNSYHKAPSQSSPIKIPFTQNGIKSSSSVCLNECKSCSQTNNGAEPGSSWQMIASPNNHFTTLRDNLSFASEAVSSSASLSSQKSSFTSSPNGFGDSQSFAQKMVRREEQLKSAKRVMIPAYKAAVQMQRKKQEQQSGTLSTMLGHLANFVKGS